MNYKSSLHRLRKEDAYMLELKTYDVVLVDFGNDVIGSEQAGLRPAIIVQNNLGNHYSETTIVIPCTSRYRNLSQSTHTLIKKGKQKGLTTDSVALAECIRQISKQRIKAHLGKITDVKEKNDIKKCVFSSFGD